MLFARAYNIHRTFYLNVKYKCIFVSSVPKWPQNQMVTICLQKQVTNTSSTYSKTVLVPKTSFPHRLEGVKRVESDHRIVTSSEYKSFYAWQAENLSDRPKYILHDGPPYANGDPHIGHAVNKILKDITIRSKILAGYGVDYRPGWDCHGLPIELKAVTSSKNVALAKESPLKLRHIAREFATHTMEKQKKEFMSWGVMGDWKNPYKTMDSSFVKKQIQLFYWMLKKGYVYQRYMPVYWSPSSKTALAESELEYNPQHKSTSVYVRFPILKTDNTSINIDENGPLYLLIWTTTPWSLMANRAVCYNPNSEYSVVRHLSSENYIVATELLYKSNELRNIFGHNPVVTTKLTGKDLSTLTYTNPIVAAFSNCNAPLPIIPASHVTMEAGTGLVHTAPAHGPDDYLIGVKYGLDLSCPVDQNGCYDSTVPTRLQGLSVLEEGNTEILNILENGGNILEKQMYIHSYPYDWRTKKPVILRASKQWFMDTRTLQPKALEVLQNVRIHPRSAINGFQGILEKRPYWCISRQRVWGVPIPVFYDQKGDFVISKDMIDRFCDLIDQHGTDFWWQFETKEMLEGLNIGVDSLTKGTDILDVWFDSGITWHNIIQPNEDNGVKQSEVYLEGLDQFSGWFYSSLLTSVALQQCAPYKQLYVHGFTMDEEGRKMSKSLGNVVSPVQITQGLVSGTTDCGKERPRKGTKNKTKTATVYGVDVLRWWVAAHASQSSAIYVGDNILTQTKQEVDRLRNVFKFLLGNLEDTNQDDLIQYENLLPLDRYILHCLTVHCKQVEELYENFNYNKVVLQTQFFVSNILSAFYFYLIKDRLYCESRNSHSRKSAIAVIFHVTKNLQASISPILPVMSREISLHSKTLSNNNTDDVSSLLTQFSLNDEWSNKDLEQTQMLIDLKDTIAQAWVKRIEEYMMVTGEDATEVSATELKKVEKLEVIITSTCKNILHNLLEFSCSGLRELFQVSNVQICSQAEFQEKTDVLNSNACVKVYKDSVSIVIRQSQLKRCPRCRLYLCDDCQNDDEHLCNRCQNVIQEL